MSNQANDKVFSGTIPEVYDALLVPLIFEQYTAEVIKTLANRPINSILEIAAGSGILTRALSAHFPASVTIAATDLNEAMLAQGKKTGTNHAVTWQQADAMSLPFPDNQFDAVLCQFGAMFFPDKAKAFAEARRVLKPGGIFSFTVWDKIEENEFAHTLTSALEAHFALKRPSFLARTPHGYYNVNLLADDVKKGGFTKAPFIETIAKRSSASTYIIPAKGYCQGTPLKTELEALSISITEATAIAAEAIGKRFGWGAVESKIQAHIVSVEK